MDYEKLFKRAKSFGIRQGLGDEADDFAQECLIKAFEINGPVKLEWIWSNYRDHHSADKRILSSPCGKLSKFRTISLDAPIDNTNEDSAKLSDVIGVPGLDVEGRENAGLIELFIESLQPKRQVIFRSMCEGRTSNEIASELNITASRVLQLMRQLKELFLLTTILPKETRPWVIKNAFKVRSRRK